MISSDQLFKCFSIMMMKISKVVAFFLSCVIMKVARKTTFFETTIHFV